MGVVLSTLKAIVASYTLPFTIREGCQLKLLIVGGIRLDVATEVVGLVVGDFELRRKSSPRADAPTIVAVPTAYLMKRRRFKVPIARPMCHGAFVDSRILPEL